MNSFKVHLRPICSECALEMICVKNGVYVHLKMSGAYVAADLFQCPCCANGIITGFAKEALSSNCAPGLVRATINL